MADYHYDNDPNETYLCLLSIGNKTNPGLDATLDYVWTDDGDGSVTKTPFKLSTSGLQFELTNKLQFRDSDIYLQSSVDGQLDIDADTEVEITTTTLDINANADISGTLGVTGATSLSSTLGVTGATALESTLEVAGATTLNGAVTLGDATSDDITVTGYIASDVIPKTDDTYDLGTDSIEWKDLYLDGTAHVDTLDVDANATITGTLGVTGETTLSDAVTVETGKKLQFVDSGEYLSGDGTDLTIASGNDINLTATAKVNLPAGIPLRLGDDGEYISGDGTDMSIVSSGAVNVTAAAASTIKATDGTLTIHADGEDDKVLIKGDSSAGVAVDIQATHADGDVKIRAGGTSGILDINGYDLDIDIEAGRIDILAAGTIDIDNSAGDINIDSHAGDINIDSQAGSVLIDGGEVAADAVKLTASGETNATLNITSTGTGASAIDINSLGGLDIDTTAGVTLDCTTLSIDYTDTTNLTMTANSASNKTLTISTTNAGAGDSLIDIDADGQISIDTTDTTDGIDIGTATSGVPITIGHSTSEVTFGDNVTVSGDCAVTGTLTTGAYSPDAITLSHATDPILTIDNAEHAGADGSGHCTIIFSGEDSTGDEVAQRAKIVVDHPGTGDDEKGDIWFKTNAGSEGSSPSTAMRLLSDQSAEFYDNVTLNATKKLIFDADGDSDTYIYESSEDVLKVYTGGSEAICINSDQNVGLGDSTPTEAKVSISGVASVVNGDAIDTSTKILASGSQATGKVIGLNIDTDNTAAGDQIALDVDLVDEAKSYFARFDATTAWTSAKDPETDAEAGWIKIMVGSTAYFVPYYAAS